jgi:ribosome-associated protein
MKEEEKETLKLVDVIVKGILDKKGHKPVVLDLRKIENASCKFFVVCHGTSNTQVDAIADNVIEEARKKVGQKPFHQEGFENAYWILLDYFDVVVHVFLEEAREFYRLEELWADADVKEIIE